MPDYFVNLLLKKNERRFFDEEEFDKEHGEKFNNIAMGLRVSVETILNNSKNSDNPNHVEEIINHHITALKNRENVNSVPNDKLINYFYKLADETKGLKETVKNFESEYTLKGVFFSYTTPVDCIIKSPTNVNL